MGCDGGTIPKRNEIVKNKQQNQARDKNADLSAKWQFCSLSGLKLKKPIVSCRLGRLYNRDAILEYLLELRTSKSSSTRSSQSTDTPSTSGDTGPTSVAHIKSIKDVKTLNLKEKVDFDEARQAANYYREPFKAQFTCPISGLDLNGKYKFHFLFTCGCVFSDRALKEVSSENKCIVCSDPYDPENDLIVLNGDESDMNRLKEKLIAKRRNDHKQAKLDTANRGKSCKLELDSDKGERNKTIHLQNQKSRPSLR